LTVTAATLFRSSIDAPRSGEVEISLLDDLHPSDVVYRIFHPPRA